MGARAYSLLVVSAFSQTENICYNPLYVPVESEVSWQTVCANCTKAKRLDMECYISSDVNLGVDVTVGRYAQVLGESHLGDRTQIGAQVIIGHPSKTRVGEEGHLEQGNGSVIGADSIIRANTVIYENVRAGKNLQTAHGVIIREDVAIGESCSFGNHAVIEPRAVMGDNVRVQSFVSIGPDAQVGNNVFIGPNVIFTNKRYMAGVLARGGKISWESIKGFESLREGRSLIIEDDVRVASNCVLLVGIKLGMGSIVGAGSVVTRDVPEFTLVSGFPARPVRKVDPETYQVV